MSNNTERLDEAREELADVKLAIKQILSGAQEYRIGSRSVHKADLATLFKERDALKDEIASLEGTSGRAKRVVVVDN